MHESEENPAMYRDGIGLAMRIRFGNRRLECIAIRRKAGEIADSVPTDRNDVSFAKEWVGFAVAPSMYPPKR